MHRLLFVTALLLPLLTQAAPAPSATTQTAKMAQTLTPVEALPLAPDFTLRDADGESYRLSALRGQPVIVNFWATWCPPCREEMPSMQRAWESLQPQGVVLLAINVGESADTIFQFTGNTQLDFPILLDEDGTVSEAWPLKGLPTTFVIDPQGRIVYSAIGGREWDDPKLLQPVLELRRPSTVAQHR
ncbi:MAG: TlpA family protein disulfide reductase [Gammaproteobacteria bacterium]|nr:TlpA family protein disulfide reductase [Gammaproteobacteria bacterium]